MIIPVMVLSSSFVRSLTLWRLSKLLKKNLSSNKRRRSKWFIFDKGGEYFGRSNETRCNPGPFVNYLQECGIDAQYTMTATSQQNEIVKRRNCTLLDMVRCMFVNS